MLISQSIGIGEETSENARIPISAPVIENDSSNFTSSGSIKLSWRSEATDTDAENAEFTLERATQADFSDAKLYYHGPDLATYISGLANGRYYFRIREIGKSGMESAWSPPVEVVVEHHSLSLAFALFGIGGLVFILTVLVVLRGASRTADPDDSPRIQNAIGN